MDKFVEKYKMDINERYPNHKETTEAVFDIIHEMLVVEYGALSSDNKKFNMLRNYLQQVLIKTFNAVGTKNYMKDIWQIFLNSEVADYFVNALGEKGAGYQTITKKVKCEIIYWQGCEGNMNHKLEKILQCFN